jgi:hypothetical protein
VSNDLIFFVQMIVTVWSSASKIRARGSYLKKELYEIFAQLQFHIPFVSFVWFRVFRLLHLRRSVPGRIQRHSSIASPVGLWRRRRNRTPPGTSTHKTNPLVTGIDYLHVTHLHTSMAMTMFAPPAPSTFRTTTSSQLPSWDTSNPIFFAPSAAAPSAGAAPNLLPCVASRSKRKTPEAEELAAASRREALDETRTVASSRHPLKRARRGQINHPVVAAPQSMALVLYQPREEIIGQSAVHAEQSLLSYN